MADPVDLADPVAVLLAVDRAFEEAGVERALYGGLALAAFGVPRETKDADLAVTGASEPRSSRYARMALERSLRGDLRGVEVRVLSPEDFILFKVLSTRERDLEDAASVLRELGSSLDMRHLEGQADLLADEIPDHDVEARLRRTRELV